MKPRTLIGLGALACIPCCLGSIVAVLGAIATIGVGSTLVIGAAGLVIVAVAVALAVVLAIRRRSDDTSCRVVDPDEPVAVVFSRSSR